MFTLFMMLVFTFMMMFFATRADFIRMVVTAHIVSPFILLQTPTPEYEASGTAVPSQTPGFSLMHSLCAIAYERNRCEDRKDPQEYGFMATGILTWNSREVELPWLHGNDNANGGFFFFFSSS
jgi:hypothetical protein